MNPDALLVFATFPDAATAHRIVRTLVEERLAACGTLIPGAESIYGWQGAIETSAELFVVLKTEASCYARMEARLTELHPYDVPECIAVQVSNGLPAYLKWVGDSVTPT